MESEEHRNIIPNPSVVRNILTLRYDPSQESLLSQKSWHDFTEKNNELDVDLIQNILENSIKQQIKHNAKQTICIALSGGVDSTLILALIRKLFPDIKINAISIKFAESIDESETAAKIAEHFEAEHHVIYLDNYLKELPKAISIVGLPFWDLHWYYVVKNAHSLSNYLASGDGGDELFGGYIFRYKNFLSLINPNSNPLEKTKAYLQCHQRDSVPDQEKLFAHKADFSWDHIYSNLMLYFNNPLPPLQQLFLADYNGKLLYNFSLVNTKIHDYFNVHSVAPILSKELIEYSTHVPHSFKYDEIKNIGKIPLRKLLKKLNADSLVSGEKQGFSVNTLNLWKSHGKELCNHFLLDSRTVRDSWISKNWIEKHIKQDNLDIRYVNKFLGLLAFEIWYRLFVTQEMNSNSILD